MNKSESKYFNTAVKMDKALMKLLEKKPFEYISISEVCKEAGVNRSTFYLHYENICDLLDETMHYLIDSFLSYYSINTEMIAFSFSDSKLNELNYITEEYLNPYLSFIKDNHCIFSTVLSNSGIFGFEKIFNRMYANIFEPILQRFNYPVEDRKYVMIYYLSGINAVVVQWIKDDCYKPIQCISRIIQECIFGLNGDLKSLLNSEN
ncbi:MAG: TetR/AcrR family transcriptional regulator [Ruminococcus sp.]|nr:TetR/AcrR family transcriptional regulator [Ruminococcus sp.]